MKKLYLSFALLLTGWLLAAPQLMAQPQLPNFNFKDLAGKTVRGHEIAFTKYLTIIYFDPTCEHCLATTQEMPKNIKKFSATKIVWISFAEKEQIADFKKTYFPKNKNMIFLHDKDMKIFDSFGDLYDTPTFIVYNKNKTLIKSITTPATIDEVISIYK